MSFRGAIIILLGLVLQASAADKKAGREEGEFRIRVGGDEIGSEKFVIVTGPDSASSTSVLDFRSPADRQRVQMESRLDMTAHYVPTSYQLKSDVDGKKGTIVGEFSPNQAIFQYVRATGQPRKAGVLVGKEFTILDTNLFHHFIFLARLFDFDSKESAQKFEVVIPQETDSGVLTIRQNGREQIQVHGKKIDARKLQVDSGSLVMQMWIDNQHVLYRISVPGKELEVVRE